MRLTRHIMVAHKGWVKQNSQEWFDKEIDDEIKNCEKLFKKFKKLKPHIDNYIYNATRYKIRKMIFDKNRSYFEKKLIEFISKPKDVWMSLTSLGLPNESFSIEVSVLKTNNRVEHDANSVLEGFKTYYSILAENLVKILPKYSINILLTLLLNIINI